MIEKKEKIIITFYTTTAAMKMEDICKGYGSVGRIIPVPGFISADCGLAWCAPPQYEQQLLQIMTDNDIVCQGIHKCMI